MTGATATITFARFTAVTWISGAKAWHHERHGGVLGWWWFGGGLWVLPPTSNLSYRDLYVLPMRRTPPALVMMMTAIIMVVVMMVTVEAEPKAERGSVVVWRIVPVRRTIVGRTVGI